jgi:hypothetical protein
VDKSIFVFRRISKIQLSAEIPLDRFAYFRYQMLGRGGYDDAILVLLHVDNTFQRPFHLSLFLHIPYAIQQLLAMASHKSAAELNHPSNLAISNLQACWAKLPLKLLCICRDPSLPDASLEQKIAFRAPGIRWIFSGPLILSADLTAFLSPETLAQL